MNEWEEEEGGGGGRKAGGYNAIQKLRGSVNETIRTLRHRR